MSDTAVTVRGRVPSRAEASGFAREYERHHQALYRYCRSILRHEEDAQDALQSAMLRAFAALQTERRELELRPWLFRIAHNESVSILRRRTATCALDDDLRDDAALEDRVLEREALRLLRADLAGLTERQRWALVLRELNGLSHGEIAAVLETSPAVVKQAIFEARGALLRCREGRDTACADIRLVLSDGDGRVLRARRIRAHLQTCSGCREFRDDLRRRPRRLAALAPPLPAGAAATLLRGLLGGSAGAASAGGGATAGLAAKAAVALALAGGAVALHAHPPRPAHRPAPTRVTPHRAAATPVPTGTASPGEHTAGGLASRPTPRHTASAPPPTVAERKVEPAGGTHAVPRQPAAPVKVTTDAAAAPAAQAEQDTVKTQPGQAKRDTAAPAPPGQAKQQTVKTPPGQAKQDTATPPPGQAKKDAAAAAPRTRPGRRSRTRCSRPVDPAGPDEAGSRRDGPAGAAGAGDPARPGEEERRRVAAGAPPVGTPSALALGGGAADHRLVSPDSRGSP